MLNAGMMGIMSYFQHFTFRPNYNITYDLMELLQSPLDDKVVIGTPSSAFFVSSATRSTSYTCAVITEFIKCMAAN